MKLIDYHYQTLEVKQVIKPTFEELDSTQISYTHAGTKKYIHLISTASNLNKGKCWYFICPYSGVRCRKLHYTTTHGYIHRSCINSLYYKQTQSRSERIHNIFRTLEKLQEQLRAKNLKKHYKGQPTKKYTYLLNKFTEAKKKEQHILNILYAGILKQKR